MRKIWLGTMLVGGIVSSLTTVSSLTYAAPADQADPMDAAIAREYQGFTVEKTEVKQINGVKVQWLKIHSGQEDSVGAVTEHGDFLIAGQPHDPNRLPGPVESVVNDLFANKPTNVDKYTVTTYLIAIDAGGHQESLVLDAVGRLKGMHPESTATQDKAMESEDVLNKDVEITKRMQSVADRFYGAGAKLEHINKDPQAEHFYHVSFTTADGHHVSMVTNGNDVFSRRMKIGEKQIPQAVLATVAEMFKGAKITNTFRRTYEYYQFDEKTNGGDTVTLKVGTNGDILDVVSQQARQENEAVQAAAHQGK